MKHPDDTRTIELPGLTVATKRGRGRPRKDDALTPAQRAQRYRARRRARPTLMQLALQCGQRKRAAARAAHGCP